MNGHLPRVSGETLINASRPRTPDAHWLATEEGGLLLVTNGTQLFDVDMSQVASLDEAHAQSPAALERALGSLKLQEERFIDDSPIESPPLRALSLSVAQRCNLACSYCYAAQGDFGGPAKSMAFETARGAVELLLRDAVAGDRLNLAFLGGEPLTNREVLRSSTRLAARLAAERDLRVTFSITTNGTLLRDDDADFFEEFGFAVTVSLDGLQDVHDRHRVFKGGGGSFDRIMRRVRPLLDLQKQMQVSVRSTVTPGRYQLREALEYFLDQGFHSVGFSPVLRAASRDDEFVAADLPRLLETMVECGEEFERRVIRGERFAFANVVNAMRELHRGTHRPYPCGAGAGYLGVSADGDLSACHRFVGDARAGMGSIDAGVDRKRQNRWLAIRHVHTQEPCQSCWARYLCGGGCHHEVIANGRPACDYIRGWLHYCLGAYARLGRDAPHWFDSSAPVHA